MKTSPKEQLLLLWCIQIHRLNGNFLKLLEKGDVAEWEMKAEALLLSRRVQLPRLLLWTSMSERLSPYLVLQKQSNWPKELISDAVFERARRNPRASAVAERVGLQFHAEMWAARQRLQPRDHVHEGEIVSDVYLPCCCSSRQRSFGTEMPSESPWLWYLICWLCQKKVTSSDTVLRLLLGLSASSKKVRGGCLYLGLDEKREH